jgi:hypothetical protein
MKASKQVGVLLKLRGKEANMQVGAIPITPEASELNVIKDKIPEAS